MANTLKFGNGEWYGKKDTILAYNDENSNYKPLPFNFSRASKATVINKDGLIETVGIGQPRIDYKDDSKGALKLEPQRTNNIQWSDLFSASSTGGYYGLYWNAIITDNNVISPDGSLNASKVVRGTDNVLIRAENVVTVSTENTATLWAKKGNYDKIMIDIGDEAASTITLTDEWQRIETTTSSALNTHIDISMPNSASGDYIYIYGFQLEEGSYSTSLINTQGSIGTRVADNIETDFGTILPLSGEVSVYMEMLGQPVNGINNTGKITSVNFDDTIDGISYVSLNFNGTDWRARVQNASGSNFVSFEVDQTETIKALFVLRPTSYALYANGNLIGNETRNYGGTAPIISEIAKVEFDNSITNRGITRNKDLRVYNTALSNAEAIALTQV